MRDYPYARLTDDEIQALVADHVVKLQRIVDLCICRALADDERVTDAETHGKAIVALHNRNWQRPPKTIGARLNQKWRTAK